MNYLDSWGSCCLGIYLPIVQELTEDASYQDQSIAIYTLKLGYCGNQLYLKKLQEEKEDSITHVSLGIFS